MPADPYTVVEDAIRERWPDSPHTAIAATTIRALHTAGYQIAPDDPTPEQAAHAGHYVSTYCQHGRHDACRLHCKVCRAPCRCSCGHPRAVYDAPEGES